MMKIWSGVALMLAAGAVWAVDGSSADARFPPGSIASPEAAEQALTAIEEERARAYVRYTEEERECHARFFVTHCLDQAKERRRQSLRPLEALEVEAKRFQRQQRAAQRDQAMMERRAHAEEKAAAAAKAEPALPEARQSSPVEPPGNPRVRQSKPAPTPQQEREEARERAENEAAYARKVEAAKVRQRAVAQRKAEKEQRRVGQDAVEGSPSN